MAITKGQLIEMLQNDDHPLSTEIGIMLEASNNDTTIIGSFEGLYFANWERQLMLNGTYKEEY